MRAISKEFNRFNPISDLWTNLINAAFFVQVLLSLLTSRYAPHELKQLVSIEDPRAFSLEPIRLAAGALTRSTRGWLCTTDKKTLPLHKKSPPTVWAAEGCVNDKIEMRVGLMVVMGRSRNKSLWH